MLTYALSDIAPMALQDVLKREGVNLARIKKTAEKIVNEVRRKGDEALSMYAQEFDGFKGGSLTVTRNQVRDASKRVPKDVMRALGISKKRIENFHSRQRLSAFEYRDGCGSYGQKIVPLNRVGVYAPGGTAKYMSSVLMSCIPARIAGVKEIALCSPGKDGVIPDEIVAAADMCGVTEIHPVGGAQSIAAMAYGTESIRPVQKIVGPGGSYVSAAKLLVRNDCEIDFLAGPSEILIIADSASKPDSIAADMLAQLEHDPLARAVLVTTSQEVLEKAKAELCLQIEKAARKEIASQAAKKGAIFMIARNLAEAVEFSNKYAPEHLLIDVRKPRTLLKKVENAGSVFLGSNSSVAFGDYCAGTNHILPTMGVASMKSSLSVYDFLKIVPYQELSAGGADMLAPIVETIALSEGLPAHAAAARSRTKKVSN